MCSRKYFICIIKLHNASNFQINHYQTLTCHHRKTGISNIVTDKEVIQQQWENGAKEREFCTYQDLNDVLEWFCNVHDNNTNLHNILSPKIRTINAYSVEINLLLYEEKPFNN